MVAAHLGRVGGGGRAYRYGGEEFTILFPRREPAGAVVHLDAVRESIAGAGFVVRADKPGPPPGGGERRKGKAAGGARSRTPGTVTVTISMGVAGPGSGGAASPAEVLKQADKALYKAKKNGRNRVEKARPRPPGGARRCASFLSARPARRPSRRPGASRTPRFRRTGPCPPAGAAHRPAPGAP